MKYCTHCGAQIDDNAKFCTRCGTPVAVIVSRPAQPVRPARAPVQPPVQAAPVQAPAQMQVREILLGELQALKTPGEMVLGSWNVADFVKDTAARTISAAAAAGKAAPAQKKKRPVLRWIIIIAVLLIIFYIAGQF